MRNLRDFYRRARSLVAKQNEQIMAAEAECNSVLQDKRFSKEYRSAARATLEQKTREAVAQCEAGMKLLQDDFRKAAFAELLPDPGTISPSLVRTLANVNLSAAEIAYLGNDLRSKGDLMGCRLLRDYAEQRGMRTQGLYMSPEEAMTAYNSFCGDISKYGYGDMDPADRGFSDLSDFDSVIDSTWNFAETGQAVPEIKVFASEDAEMAAALHAQHEETEAQKQAFLRGWDPASAAEADRAEATAKAQQALWNDGLNDASIEAMGALLQKPETVQALLKQAKTEATRQALEALQASLQAQADADSGQDPEGEGASGAEIAGPF